LIQLERRPPPRIGFLVLANNSRAPAYSDNQCRAKSIIKLTASASFFRIGCQPQEMWLVIVKNTKLAGNSNSIFQEGKEDVKKKVESIKKEG